MLVHERHSNSLGGTMSKAKKEVPELTDQELAFEMIEITCEEMDSLTRAFEMLTNVCKELNDDQAGIIEEELLVEEDEEIPSEAELH